MRTGKHSVGQDKIHYDHLLVNYYEGVGRLLGTAKSFYPNLLASALSPVLFHTWLRTIHHTLDGPDLMLRCLMLLSLLNTNNLEIFYDAAPFSIN